MDSAIAYPEQTLPQDTGELDRWRATLSDEGGRTWMEDGIVRAMQSYDLTSAGKLAAILAAVERGSRWYPPGLQTDSEWATRPQPPDARLSIGKLRHDSDQFRYLRQLGVLGAEFDAIVQAYDEIAERLSSIGMNGRVPLEPEDELRIGEVYNRIVYIRPTPRVPQALSPDWNRTAVQHRYLYEPPGLVVIDDFLTSRALQELRSFCLESTVWSGNRYAEGRLGALFFTGFNCPLLLQVAEEIREAFPLVIGDRHPLRQLWGFKYPPQLSADSTVHADFAAVNVNFWVTPESANLDTASGGLVVYDVAAPLSWDFALYNENQDAIRNYLWEQRARAIVIPYRQNRAIIFNSDLFHATAQVRFLPEYENRRVNITMLYGDREHDTHHPVSSDFQSPADEEADGRQSNWRSASFSRGRRAR